MKKIFNSVFIIALAGLSSCNQEYLNPSAASQSQVIKDVNGLLTLANGLQYKYSISQVSPNYNLPTASGLLTKELLNLNAGNTSEQKLMEGGVGVLGSNAVLSNLWGASQLIRSNADLILDNLSVVADKETKRALQAHASIFKALALGNLALFWEQAPITTANNAPFVPRLDVLKAAIRTLDSAKVELAKSPVSKYFADKVVSGINYANTINALIARFAMIAGDYDKALSAASSVNIAPKDIASKSFFSHDDLTRNVLFEVSFSNRNLTEPWDNKFGLPAELQTPASDSRIGFFFNPEGGTGSTNRGKAGFFASNSSPLPFYRIGEMRLIKAEANVRKSPPDLNAAVAELNEVLTKKPSEDAWGIGAEQPAYSGNMTAKDILTEIYRQRCIELYLTGLRLEDSRRFNRPESERGRNFLPYPFSERDNNINTPPDPVF